MKTLTRELVQVRKMSIQSKSNPEWGTFGIMEDTGEHLVILGNGGFTVLHYGEMHFWHVVE